MRTFILIGGGEIKVKQTLKIDTFIAGLAKARSGERRANALFVPTASHDFMPYFNSFKKIYTGEFDIKVDVALMCRGEMDIERISAKAEAADIIYIGGGDTVFMLNKWRETGFDRIVEREYKKGKIICGLSAGAICWFKEMYSDSGGRREGDAPYRVFDGLSLLDGLACPHYDERVEDFDKLMLSGKYTRAIGIENNAAAVYEDEQFVKALGSGSVFFIEKIDGALNKIRAKIMAEIG